MSPEDKDRLRKLFAMLQSPYEGEVQNALRLIKQILQDNGKTINDLIGELDWDAPSGNNQYQYGNFKPDPPSPPPDPPEQQHNTTPQPANATKADRIVMIKVPSVRNATLVGVGLCIVIIGIGLLANYRPPPLPQQSSLPNSSWVKGDHRQLVYQPEKPRDPPKPEQITLKDLVLADIVLPDQSGKGGIQGVITNNSTLSLERVTFEVTLKDGNQLISTTTTEICSFNWYVKHSGCWESCAGATLPVPPHQVRQLRTCALRFGQISQLKNPRIGYRVTQLNENDMQTETLFAQSPAEQPSPRSLPTPTVSAASPKVETTDEKLAKEVPVVAASPAYNSNEEPGYNAHTDCYPDGCARVEAFQKEATRLVTTLITNQEIGAEMRSAHYADTVNYYGSVKSRGAVTVDIQQFINRWPRRTYRITSINTTCTTRPARNYCVVAGEVAYQAEAPNRRSVGTATFEFTVINDDGTLLVSTENGRTLTRQVSAK